MNEPNVEGVRRRALVGKVSLVNMKGGKKEEYGGLLVMLMQGA